MPFSDPAQVGYVSWLERRLDRAENTNRNLRAKHDEMRTAILLLSQYLEGKTTWKDGKLVRFDGITLEPSGEGPNGT